MPLVSFTDDQIAKLKTIAALLPAGAARESFLRSVGNRLADLPHPPNDADIQAALDFDLSCRSVAGGVQAFSNVKSTDKSAAASARAERQFRTGVSR